MPDASSVIPVGDAAMCVRLATHMSASAHQRVRQYLAFLRHNDLAGITEWSPGYASVMVYYNPLALCAAKLRAYLTNGFSLMSEVPVTPARRIEVPVCYGGANGPDLSVVAEHAGLSPDAVVARHAQALYRVDFIGFSPGFPYLSGMDATLSVPRKDTPRQRVPKGSVAIAGRQTGIYAEATAGGWQIIGRTALALFDATAPEPCLFRFGDEVRFRIVDCIQPGTWEGGSGS